MNMIKRTLAFSLSALIGAGAYAAPAPVTDLNGTSLERRVDVLERIVNSRTDMQLNIQRQLDSVQDEVSELRGTLELHNHQLEQILERQRELYLEIDRRIEAVSTGTSGNSVANTSSAGGQKQQDTAPVMNRASESDAYDKAVNLILRDKQYDQAIPEFQSFLERFPNSSYAANAHYWLGQLLFNKQEWAAAAEQFQVLASGYPDSTKRADALFKLGVVEQKRQNLARAEELFNQVVAEYPESSSRKLADSRLKSLN